MPLRVSLANLLKSALALKVEIEEQRESCNRLRGSTGASSPCPQEPVSVSDEYNWWPLTASIGDELETEVCRTSGDAVRRSGCSPLRVEQR